MKEKTKISEVWIDKGIRNRLQEDSQGGIYYSWQFLNDSDIDWHTVAYLEPWVASKLLAMG